MKFLLVLLLVGLGLAAAVPFTSNDVELYNDSDDDYLNAVFFDDEGDEIARDLQNRFAELLEKVKDAFEHGRTIGFNLINEVRKMYQEMRDKGIPFGDKIKEIAEKIREKATGLWKKIMDQITGGSKRSIDELEYLFAEEELDKVAQDLQDRFRELLEQIKEAFEKGRTVGADIIRKLKNTYQEMRKKAVPMGEEIKNMIKEIRDNASGFWKNILDTMLGGRYYLLADEVDEDEELQHKLGEFLREVLVAFENHRTVSFMRVFQIQDLAKELRKKNIPLGEEIRDLIRQLREMTSGGMWKRILDDIAGENFYLSADDFDKVARDLQDKFQELLDQIKEAFEKGKTLGADMIVKLKNTYQEMRKKGVPMGEEIKNTIKEIKDKASGLWKRILDKMTGESYYMLADEGDDVAEKLREKLRELLEKMKDAFEHGREIGVDLLYKIKAVHDEMMEKSIPFGGKIKEFIAQVREKATGLWKRILDRISRDQYYLMAEDTAELVQKLRAHFDEILEKVNSIVENGKALKEDYIQKLKDIRQKLRDMHQDISDHAKELLTKLKEKGKEYWKKILEKLKLGSDVYIAEGTTAEDLRNQLMELLEKLREAFRNKKIPTGGFISKLRELFEKFRDGNIPFGEKIQKIMTDLKERATGVWKRILERFDRSNKYAVGMGSEFSADDDIKTELGKRLKEKFDELLEKVRDAIENGKTVKEDTLHKLSELREQLRDMKVDLGEKARNLLENLKEKAKDYWKKILDKIRE